MEKDKELYNSLVLDTYVKLINEKYPEILIDDLMEYAGIENYEIGDYSVWFTQAQVNRFHEKLSSLTDNLKIAREAGRFAAHPRCLGEIRGMILSLGGIRNAFKMIGNYAKRLNRSSIYTTKSIGRNKIQIRVTPKKGVREKEFQCQNRIGNFTGIADIFYNKDITIDHPKCLFKGDDSCTYVISWKESAHSVLNRLKWLSGLATLVLFPVYMFGGVPVVTGQVAMGSFIVFLILGWGAQTAGTSRLKRSLNEIYENKEDLLKQIDINAENSRAIIDIGHALRMELTDSDIFNRIAEITGRRLKYDRVMIMIANEAVTQLIYRGGFGFTPKEMAFLEKYTISLQEPSEGVFFKSFNQNKPILVNDMKQLKEKSTRRSFSLAEQIQPVAFICCPITFEDTVIGIIVAGNVETPKKMGRNDKHLVMGVAQQIGGAYHKQTFEIQRNEFNHQLAELQKMKTLGILSGGIAHDFNNILSPIIGYTDLCLSIIPEEHEIRHFLSRIRKASVRAQDLVKQILTFSTQVEQKNVRLKMGGVVNEALQLLKATLPATIEIKQHIAPRLSPILADPTQIHQVIMNLCTNAYHAMKKNGGILSVSLDQKKIDPKSLGDQHHLAPGPYIRLTVSDTGHGMDKETLEKIFEPYFTTKKKGTGTGLGLSITHGIVTRMKGHISVTSTPDQGTCFNIYLPQIIVEDTPVHFVTDNSIPSGSESILVVDDDELILDLITETLQRLGYDITACNDSTLAYDTFCRTPDAFDLIITDMTMPGMTGVDLAHATLKIRPDIPIVLCTGYSDTIDENMAKAIGFKSFLMKPVGVQQLATCLRKMLNNTGDPGRKKEKRQADNLVQSSFDSESE
ncbi:sensor histidine kinase [Desulfotignum phosphitoxidans]|jgi:signal transduction histidine kinase/CheY-like chemotaxis protein|uniref:histidine kinase n=1 Tax=Desulfotignum phosphitoxidans DSM 13687 TaxID=1286635 RepID=S0G234_9BACT|nr:ATP-binding protein [Desulfotignum phosphitoxidans]EMS80990.1 signal transduction histidine kinase [Desulfotignum phosphitoxidans DSM 13687]